MIIHDYILGLSSFILECALDTQNTFIWSALMFYASKNQSYEILTFYTPIDADWLVRDVSMIMFYRGLTGGAVCRV